MPSALLPNKVLGLSVRGGGVNLLSQVLAISGLQSLYDPSDLTSLYQSRTGGSTGAVDSVVGIMLDKSQMGGKTAAAFIAGQSELVSGSWSMSASGTATATESPAGTLNLTGDGTNSGIADKSFTTVIDSWYALSFTVGASALSGARVGTSSGGSQIQAPIAFSVGAGVLLFKASSTTTWIRFNKANAALCTVAAISLKALPGYHALAPSDAARPILRAGYYLDCDGTDDWMQVFPTLNLGEQWWHVGGWRNDSGASSVRAFGTTDNFKDAAYPKADGYYWRNAADSGYLKLVSGTPSSAHVVTLERATGATMTASVNGVRGSSTAVVATVGTSLGLALFSQFNTSFTSGLDGRFYGGAFGTGTLSSADRSILERYVAGLTGVTL